MTAFSSAPCPAVCRLCHQITRCQDQMNATLELDNQSFRLYDGFVALSEVVLPGQGYYLNVVKSLPLCTGCKAELADSIQFLWKLASANEYAANVENEVPYKPSTSAAFRRRLASISGPSWLCSICKVHQKSDTAECNLCVGDLWEIFRPATGSWSCTKCMISNTVNAIKCVVCKTRRPKAKKAIVWRKAIAPRKRSTDPVFARLVAKQSANQWQCSECLIRNDSKWDYCQCCKTEKLTDAIVGANPFYFGLRHEHTVEASGTPTHLIIAKKRPRRMTFEDVFNVGDLDDFDDVEIPQSTTPLPSTSPLPSTAVNSAPCSIVCQVCQRNMQCQDHFDATIELGNESFCLFDGFVALSQVVSDVTVRKSLPLCTGCRAELSQCVQFLWNLAAANEYAANDTNKDPYKPYTSVGFRRRLATISGPSWLCRICKVHQKSETAECRLCVRDLWSIFRPAKDTWSCAKCMISNKMDAVKCAACKNRMRRPRKAIVKSKVRQAIYDPIFAELVTKQCANRWECPECFVRNDLKCDWCQCCATEKLADQTTIGVVNVSIGESGFYFGLPFETTLKAAESPLNMELAGVYEKMDSRITFDSVFDFDEDEITYPLKRSRK